MPESRPAPGSTPTAATPTRTELLMRWNEARRRRESAALGSDEYRKATIDVGELEVWVNALDVAASEGRAVRPAQPGEAHRS
jgi:hypothetical protein